MKFIGIHNIKLSEITLRVRIYLLSKHLISILIHLASIRSNQHDTKHLYVGTCQNVH